MKKNISICLALFLAATCIRVQAQDKKNNTEYSKGFIGINGGYSSLMGNITKANNYLDNSQGFAVKGGPVLSLDGAYFFNKHIGAGLVVSIANYGVAGQNILSEGYVEAFAVDEVTMTVGSYKTLNILPAFYYSLPMNNLHIDFRLMVGYSSLTTPAIKVQLEDATDTPFIQNKSTGGGLGYGLGAGLRYKFGRHIGAALRIDYINSKPNVDVTYTNLNNPTEGLFRKVTKYNESIGSVNASLGLTFNF